MEKTVLYNNRKNGQMMAWGLPVTSLATGQDLEANHGQQRRAGF